MAALLQLVEQVAEPAADHAAGRATRQQAPEAALEQAAKSATKTAAAKTTTESTATGHAGVDRRGRRRRRVGLIATEVLDGLVSQQSQDCHGDRRHPAAAVGARGGRPA